MTRPMTRRTGGSRSGAGSRSGTVLAVCACLSLAGCAEAEVAGKRQAPDVADAGGEDGAPRFVAPAGAGTIFEPSRERCLALPVEVSDADSRTVAIGLRPPAPEGATLTPEGSRRSRLIWCPATAATGEALVRFVLTADDGNHPATEKPYVVLVRWGAR